MYGHHPNFSDDFFIFLFYSNFLLRPNISHWLVKSETEIAISDLQAKMCVIFFRHLWVVSQYWKSHKTTNFCFSKVKMLRALAARLAPTVQVKLQLLLHVWQNGVTLKKMWICWRKCRTIGKSGLWILLWIQVSVVLKMAKNRSYEKIPLLGYF